MRPRTFLAIVGGAALLALVGCGSDSSSGMGSPLDKGKEQSSASSSPSASGPSQPAGNWKHQPGQVEKVQQTLTAAGFECTRHSDTSIDLRLCSKGLKQRDTGQFGGPQLVGGMLRFFSAPDGTVLFAKITATGADNAKEWDAMRLQMLKAVLPADDAAVIAADGDKLTWGTYFKDPANSISDGWLQANGYDPSTLSPSGDPLPITKEQALPKLAATKLKCEFGDLSGSETDTVLGCSDPSFNGSTADGVIGRIELTDTGSGISGILVSGLHDEIKAELPAVRKLAPKLSVLGDTKVVPGLLDWAKNHLDPDGVPHSAYIGDRLVESGGTGSPIGGWEVQLAASLEKPALGYDPTKTGTN